MVDRDAIVGTILGTAVGDAIGLPYEGISARRAARLLGHPTRHRFVFGRGMVSDDTEHACFTAEALAAARGDPAHFEKHLARSLRWWLLGLPAGTGLATLRAAVKLWLGVPPSRSGVFSAGNGPAMRSPLIGVVHGDEPDALKHLVLCSTRLTHTDPKAFFGAMGAAVAAHCSATGGNAVGFRAALEQRLAGEPAAEFLDLTAKAIASAERGEPVADFASAIGSRGGISGYIYHTVPCVVQVWLRFPSDFAAAIQEIVGAGGDADSTGAILGAIIGARVGKSGIPAEWLAGIAEWPRTTAWMERLGDAVARSLDGDAAAVPRLSVPGVLLRNVAFLAIVLAHGFRRLAPPY